MDVAGQRHESGALDVSAGGRAIYRIAVVAAVMALVAGCAVGETPDVTGDAGPDSDGSGPPDVDMVDVGDAGPTDDATTDTRRDVTPPDTDAGACGGCLLGEVCHNGRCQDICVQAGASCGEATWQGATADCGSCGGGEFCGDNTCREICQRTGAECGQVWWGGSSASCGSCGSGRCVGNRCVAQDGYSDITGGYRHSCGVLASGAVECWGRNSVGELGIGQSDVDRETTPAKVNSLNSAVAVASHNYHTCAVASDGTLHCWGINEHGQLGTGAVGGKELAPQQVSSLSNVTSAGVGNLHSCAVSGGGGVCWGDSESGKLGTGQSMSGDVPTPQAVTGVSDVRRVDAGAAHTCALKSDGTVWCWGARGQGRLGDGSVFGSSAVPVQVSQLRGATEMAVGNEHTCVVVQTGEVYCWGAGAGGRLGNDDTGIKSVPVKVSMPSGVRAIDVAAGARFSCMRTAGNEVYCWGEYRTQDGTFRSFGSTPARIELNGEPVALGAGSDHVCVIIDDGSAKCWGNNAEGQLGNADTSDSFTPVTVQ